MPPKASPLRPVSKSRNSARLTNFLSERRTGAATERVAWKVKGGLLVRKIADFERPSRVPSILPT